MRLDRMIAYLEKLDPKEESQLSLYQPHSYRGSYSSLAFSIQWHPQTAGKMLHIVKSAHGQVFQGHKGGDYYMDSAVEVYLVELGKEDAQVSSLLLDFMFRKERPKRYG